MADLLSHRRFSSGRRRNLVDDLDAEAFEASDFARVIGKQANASKVQVRQNLRANTDLALGAALALRQCRQLLFMMELDGHAVAEPLYRVALRRRMQVNQRAAAFFGDAAHRSI